MSKSIDIDLSDDRLLAIAADMLDDHNYIGALKMLNKNAGISGNDEDSYMLYAEIFDDLGLSELSVHSWFKFLDVVEFNELSDCYEGLAVGFMNLGNEHFSAYYYNKLLLETDDVDSEMREQIVRDFLSVEDNPLKFVYPPEIADVTDILSSGVGYMKENKFDEAYNRFAEVAEGNPDWVTSRNYMAMCLIIQDKIDEAEKMCQQVLEIKPDNIQALITLAAVKTEAGKTEEAAEIAEKLIGYNLTDGDDLFKIATVCCENKMHAEAYKLLSSLPEEISNELNILYFKAVSAFNSKQFNECFETFDRLLTIYPDAVTARFYYDVAREMKERGEWSELSYFYVLPQDVRESSLKALSAFVGLSRTKAAQVARQINIGTPVRWCFDDSDPKSAGELQTLGAHAAVLARMDDYVRDLLLNPFFSEKFKIDLLEDLVIRNEDNVFGIVLCNIYKKVNTFRISIGAKRRNKFVVAYSHLVSRFGILDESYSEKFKNSAERIYVKLQEAGRLEAADDMAALAVAIFEDTGIKDDNITKDMLYGFFDITEERMKTFGGEI